MSDYVIGDIHAHPEALERMCKAISLKPSDRLYLLGDLVRKGPDSWGVLDYIRTQLPAQTRIVFGNHDLHFLAKLSKQGYAKLSATQKACLDIYKEANFALYASHHNALFIHAGAWPTWTLQETLAIAEQTKKIVQHAIQQETIHDTLYGNENQWNPNLPLWPRTRCAINIFTRMRTLHKQDRTLDFAYTGDLQTMPGDLIPWFDCIPITNTYRMYFGHWAMLKGITYHPMCQNMDMGYTYGHALMGMRLDDGKPFILHAT